ncbi:hypothetical protein RWU60_07570 [Acinetobacter baumannii]|uniref:hypothetical protein n=1 Tax=Acinetobacter baumannii TaxID=470 RepID=UPI002958D0E0|nr:hypothetical protein [Acinetobacter baumannii]WNX61358.1 hypothetical protein RWU60_07570 [Acinetobacter baumannii]
MRYRKQDDMGDYSFGSGLNDFHIDSAEAIAQAIDSRLKQWIGEWFADTSDGTGWSQAILGKQSKSLYELTLRKRVLETYGVVSIESFQSLLDPDVRRLTVSMTVNTIFGKTTLTGAYDQWHLLQ